VQLGCVGSTDGHHGVDSVVTHVYGDHGDCPAAFFAATVKHM